MEIKIMKNIMGANEKIAEENRTFFKSNKITAVNIMASPGAGKTSIIKAMIGAMKDIANIGVIEGDIASSIDAEKIERLNIPVVQINTAGACHLDAAVIREAVDSLPLLPSTEDHSAAHGKSVLLLIENVGNLVCPSSFDLGEQIKLVIASVPEGHDKPYKYISMFEGADVIILNKTDLLPYIDFDKNAFYKGIEALNQNAPIFEVSCTTGAGIEEFTGWLKEKLS